MRCAYCHADLSPEARFCPECGLAITTCPPFMPAPNMQMMPAPNMQMMTPQIVEESEYYHIDAMEKPDFDAMRGISIVLIVLSVLFFVTILFPLPLAIIALVKSCSGAVETNPYVAKKTFNTCRVLIIISIVVMACVLVGFYIYEEYLLIQNPVTEIGNIVKYMFH